MNDLQQDMANLGNVADLLVEFAVNYGFQLLGAVIILFIGWYVARWFSDFVVKVCSRAGLDITLSRFFAGLAKTVVIVFVVIIALGKFGISIAPFIAALGAIAFGSTLALQGPLSNYGAGITIILTRPFVVGDTIRVLNVIGIVEEIKLAYTQLSSEDGELITIPNKHIVGEVIHNSGVNLVVESSVGISYQCDVDTAIDKVMTILQASDVVADTPAPQVGIQEFADSAIEIGYRYWVPTRDYHRSRYSINKKVLDAFRSAAITIPFPQHEVRLVDNNS